MAMLAEPRQRKRYNLVPRGKALYEDDSRFGTKMLEKMGWKKGEGLGAKSEGTKDFIRIRYKNDAFGLGFEQRDDQWTEHEKSFSGLLSTLNNEESDISRNKENQEANETESLRVGFVFQNATSKEETKMNDGKLKEKISGVSLEERSKQSKARVHYKKFTKGKDLAQYSEKDLANIFGKKAVDGEQEVNAFYKNLNEVFGVITEETNDVSINGFEVDPENNSKKKDKKKKKKDDESEVACQNEFSEDKTDNQPKTYTSSLSLQDYFKMKMEAIRNRKTIVNNEMELDHTNNPSNDEQKEDLRKQKKKRKKEAQDIETDCFHEPGEKKSKKTKKQFDQEIVFEKDVAKESEGVKKVKKSKKREESNEFSQETKSKIDDVVNNCLEVSKERKWTETEDMSDQDSSFVKDIKILDAPAEKKSKKCKKSRLEKEEISKKSGNKEYAKTISIAAVPKIEDIPDECLTGPSQKKSKKTKDKLIQECLTANGKKSKDSENVKSSKQKDANEAAETLLEEIKSEKKKHKTKKECDSLSTHFGAKEMELGETKSESAETFDLKEPFVDLTKEQARKKKKKNKKDINVLNDIIEIVDHSDKDEDTIVNDKPSKEEKNKSINGKESSGKTEALETATISSTNLCNQLAKETKKEVSPAKNDVNFQDVGLEELKQKYQAFNVLTISTFCAEKFRNISVHDFKGSTLPQIEGYGLSQDLQLEIKVNNHDEERISNLWKNAFNKYEQPFKPKKDYRSYVREAITAIKTKQRPPKLHIKSWQRKNVFKVL